MKVDYGKIVVHYNEKFGGRRSAYLVGIGPKWLHIQHKGCSQKRIHREAVVRTEPPDAI